MVYMDTNEFNTHADPPLGSRWAQMWVHMWAQTMVRFLVYVTKGNIKTRFNLELKVIFIPEKQSSYTTCHIDFQAKE